MQNQITLEVHNLVKTFKISKKQQKIKKNGVNYIKAVDDVSFKLKKGEIYSLLGPNGAGKTTALRMIATLITPDSGKILLDGNEYSKDITKIKQNIGFLTSELKLEEFFTPNYMFDFIGSLHGISEEQLASRKSFLFNKFGIDKFAEVKISNLSTGMKQKLSIAVSILHNPELIIFDEPTNGLDVLTAKVVTDYLQELRNEGKTIIISTHIFSLAEKLSDRIGIIINGKLLEEGTLHELVQEGEGDLEGHFFNLYKKEVGE